MEIVIGKNWALEFDKHFITLEENDRTLVWPRVKAQQVMDSCIKYTRLESDIILKLITLHTGKQPFVQSDEFVIEDLERMDYKRSLREF